MKLDKDTLPTAVGSVLQQNNYEVEYSVKFAGAEMDIVATAIGNPFSPKLYIEATVEYVNNTKYGKDVTKFIALREIDPSGILIIVSREGFTPDVKERAEKSRIRTFTYKEFFGEFERFQPYIDHVLQNLELQKKSNEYEEANFTDLHGDEVASEWLIDWAQDEKVENPWIILLGEYGTGKTCLTEVLQYRLTKDYMNDPSGVIAIRVSLREFSRQFDARTLLHHFLDNNHLSHIPIDFIFSLIRKNRIVLLLDGYDEMAQFMNPRERRACLKTLADLSAEGARGVLTSRPNYFTQDEELRVFEALYSSFDHRSFHIGVSDKALLNEEAAIDRLVEEHILNRFERILKDLTPEQTKSLVVRKLSHDPTGMEMALAILAKTFKDETKIQGQKNLSGKPVIITYLLEIIDEIKEDGSEFTLTDLSEWQIYRLIIDKLMLRDYRRSPSVNPISRRDFLQDLAVRLSGRDEGVARQELFFDLVPRHFKEELRLLSPEDKRRRIDELFDDMRSSATLTRTAGGDGWTFSHNSLREFLVASSMVGDISHRRSLSNSGPISPVMSEFVGSIPQAELEDIIAKFRKVWKEKSVHVGLLSSHLSLLWPSFRKSNGKGFEIFFGPDDIPIDIQNTRVSDIRFSDVPGLSNRRIRGTGSEFSGVSFAGMSLTNCDFRGVVMDGVSFVDCVLTSTVFDGALLFDCNFVNCELEGSSFKGIDDASSVLVSIEKGGLIRLEGSELIGYLAFHGCNTGSVSSFDRLSFHPKIGIVDKILDRLSSQRNCQLRGLTQRGEAQKDPPFARGFVDILVQKNWISTRGNMVGLTAEGRDMAIRYFEGNEMPREFQTYLDRS